jgi:hypothetical protein
MNRNLVGSIYMYIISSIKIAHFYSIENKKTWSIWTNLASDWPKLKKIYCHLKLGGTMNYYSVGMMYRISCTKVRADHKSNMTAVGSSCLWLTYFKNSSLKPFAKINWNLLGITYERFCIKFLRNKMLGERHRLSPLNLYFCYPAIV